MTGVSSTPIRLSCAPSSPSAIMVHTLNTLLSMDKLLSTNDTNRPIGSHSYKTLLFTSLDCSPASAHSTTGSHSLNITYKFHACAHAVPFTGRLSNFALQQDTGLCRLHKPIYVSDAPCQCWTVHSLPRMPCFHPSMTLKAFSE